MVEILIYVICMVLLIRPTAHYLQLVYSENFTRRYKAAFYIEAICAKIIGYSPDVQSEWKGYLKDLLCFFTLCFVVIFLLLLAQSLFADTTDLEPMTLSLAFNIACSFLTGTNLQSYTPELTITLLNQNIALTPPEFIAPALDMTVAIALFRAMATTGKTIGNFWQDFTRSVLFVLIPAATIIAIFNMSQGVVQSMGNITLDTLMGENIKIFTGSTASQQTISMLATNGAGYFGSNMAHPFANPTPLTNFVGMLMIIWLPASFFYLFGLMIHNKKHAIIIMTVITLCISMFAAITVSYENEFPQSLSDLQIDMAEGNMEGKEQRFTTESSSLWGMLTTATTSGSSNASYDSFSAISVAFMIAQMMFGEVLFGGVGLGVINMIALITITVFIASLMIGRTPEYLHKKLGVLDIRLAVLMLLIPAVFLCVSISLISIIYAPEQAIEQSNIGLYSQNLYVVASAAFNNGSMLGNLHTNTTFYNILLGITMLACGLLPKVFACALAGSMITKTKLQENALTLKTDKPVFGLLLFLMMIMSALSYVPMLMIGPVAKYMGGM